ncbi:type-X family DNA polymerase [Sporobolomyces salmoneus]|uniref:type-X family DNA polymerase n=1 Tax=Sporobolomyces salmoneus TaxID=183962 RepID=UPI00317DFAB4
MPPPQNTTSPPSTRCRSPSPTASSWRSPSSTSESDPFSLVPPYACKRPSPYPCPNQALVDALTPLREYRFVLYGTAEPESISYATAISTIIGCPVKIETIEQARRLPKVGEKISLKIKEFLETGKIQDAIDLKTNEEFLALKELQTVHGIGHTTSLSLYEQGYRSIRDLRAAKLYSTQLEYYEDSQEKIPREEVELIAEFVKIQIARCRPNEEAIVEICGGYRRGKQFSNDVDLLITYPHQEGIERGLLGELLERLQKKGFIAQLHSSQSPASLRSTSSNKRSSRLDCLDRAFITFCLPSNGTTRLKPKYRRLDLIVVNWKTWGTALQSWTGSTQVNRDLRRWADKKGYSLDAGGLRNKTTDQVLEISSEKELYRILELEYIPPTLRRADP